MSTSTPKQVFHNIRGFTGEEAEAQGHLTREEFVDYVARKIVKDYHHGSVNPRGVVFIMPEGDAWTILDELGAVEKFEGERPPSQMLVF